VVCFELEAYPEPKNLNRNELKELIAIYGSQGKAAKGIGISRSFISKSLKKN
jgi:DNA invertase Pin-like site-specific DNA recombinase